MKYKKYIIINIIMFLLIIITLITKLFTFYTFCSDEPTAMIVMRYKAEWENFPQSDCPSYNDTSIKILFSDENELLFEGVYFFVVRYGWWIFILLWLLMVFITVRNIR